MSKIAKIPIYLSEGVTATVAGDQILVSGTKGSLTFTIPQGIQVVVGNGKIQVEKKDTADENAKALAGLTRATIANMVTGVSKGFERKLELTGVGYRAQASGSELTLFVGYSHPVKIKAEPGIQFSFADNTIVISGIDKALVGNTAAKVRRVRPPEPYKGKGIKYQNEWIRRKAGKAAKAVGAK